MYFILNCKFYECVLSLSCTNDYNRTHVTTKIQFKKLGSLGTVSPCTVRTWNFMNTKSIFHTVQNQIPRLCKDLL